MPLTKLKARSEKAQLDHWCKEHQPGKGETEDEFAKRAAKMVRRGVVAQEALGRKTGATFAKAKEPPHSAKLNCGDRCDALLRERAR